MQQNAVLTPTKRKANSC